LPAIAPARSASTTRASPKLSQLASRCEQVFGGPQDLEWAVANGRLHLLQGRLVTTAWKPTGIRVSATMKEMADSSPLPATRVQLLLAAEDALADAVGVTTKNFTLAIPLHKLRHLWRR
jgi:hypothetical protein